MGILDFNRTVPDKFASPVRKPLWIRGLGVLLVSVVCAIIYIATLHLQPKQGFLSGILYGFFLGCILMTPVGLVVFVVGLIRSKKSGSSGHWQSSQRPEIRPASLQSVQTDPQEGLEMSEGKQRHGCLATLLVVIIIANIIALVMYFSGRAEAPEWAVTVRAMGAIANIVCSIALFRWKKWGFVGLIVTAIVAFVVNLMCKLNIAYALPGLLVPAILYGVLQLGKEKKGWLQLEVANDKGFFRKLANGDFKLAKTFWLCGVLAGFILNNLTHILLKFNSSGAMLAIVFFAYTTYEIPLIMGTWRAAYKYQGPKVWAVLAKYAVLPGAFFAEFELMAYLCDWFDK